MLLTSRYSSLAKLKTTKKNKKKNKCRNCSELMARTKATVRRLPRPTFIPAPGQRIGNENILNRRLRNTPFKIKKLMSETKQVEVKKNFDKS